MGTTRLHLKPPATACVKKVSFLVPLDRHAMSSSSTLDAHGAEKLIFPSLSEPDKNLRSCDTFEKQILSHHRASEPICDQCSKLLRYVSSESMSRLSTADLRNSWAPGSKYSKSARSARKQTFRVEFLFRESVQRAEYSACTEKAW